MAFKLRNQSPLKQSTGNPFKFDIPKKGEKITSQQGLNSKGESETRYYRGNKEVSSEESNILRNKDAQKATHKRQDYNRAQPHATTKALMDVTGVSQWDEAGVAARDLKQMTKSALGFKSAEGYKWNTDRAIADAFDIVGAVPVYGRIKAAQSGLKLAKSAIKPAATIAKKIAGHAAVTLTGAAANANIEKNKKKSPVQQNSPLLKQKLSAKAAKAKAVRDLQYAKTDDRRTKKAHSQRMHRKHPGNNGKDYDHEDGRFESVKQNRGNEGEGTKKESGKKYKMK
jgi:hypothetical protein